MGLTPLWILQVAKGRVKNFVNVTLEILANLIKIAGIYP
jgi:hypothetical protein